MCLGAQLGYVQHLGTGGVVIRDAAEAAAFPPGVPGLPGAAGPSGSGAASSSGAGPPPAEDPAAAGPADLRKRCKNTMHLATLLMQDPGKETTALGV